jgi:lactate dehydrogenase-like 2-hydroxyacid dehydrogenase
VTSRPSLRPSRRPRRQSASSSTTSSTGPASRRWLLKDVEQRTLAQQSDAVSLHIPLTPDTKHIITRTTLANLAAPASDQPFVEGSLLTTQR